MKTPFFPVGSAGRILAKLVLAILCCGVLGCQTIPDSSPKEKDGKVFGTTDGSFRNQWWNYYERGLSFADGNFWEEGINDLKQAISQRDTDQRRARTYGFHFVDYFPHRELGIIYFKQGLFSEAIEELAMSLAAVTSSKAQLYLDRARKALIQQKQPDTKPPEVDIQSPKNFLLTNAFSILVQGIARSDAFVQHIRVGDVTVRIDGSAPEVYFSEEIPIVAGRNDIPVVVTDLMGNSTKSLLTITVDRVGPIIRINEPVEGDFAPGAEVLLKGYANDDAGVAELAVNGQPLFCDGKPEVKIERAVSLGSGENDIVVQAKDGVGNITTAIIASAGVADYPGKDALLAVPKDQTSPTIQIRNMGKERCTYLREALIEGKISDEGMVTQLYVNETQILSKPGKKIHFSHLVGLREGNNIVTIRAVDGAGNEETVRAKIEQLSMKVRDVGSRLRVAVYPFKKESLGVDQQLSYGLEDLLLAAMIERGRFSTIERQQLQAVLAEQKLSQSGLVDEKTALRLGKILAADGILFGNVLERANSVEAYLRIIDTETTQVLAAVDIYGEEVDIAVLRTLGEGLELKLTQEMPLVEGLVVQNDGDRITVDLGKQTGIKCGMKLFVYELGESIQHPQTGAPAGGLYREMGQARIQSIMEQVSSAQMMEGADLKDIQKNNYVITR